MTDNSTGLFGRWSQRRQAVEQEELALEEQAEAEKQAAMPAQQLTKLEEDSISYEESEALEPLPDPEQIENGGSFASFMADNVDPTKKAAALRALWKQPHYNEIDGLLEYALDYTNQPLLTEDVSAELAKKVFRHVVKDESENDQDEALQAENQNTEHDSELDPMADTTFASNEGDESPENQQFDGLVESDNLASVNSVAAQNEPETVKLSED